MKIVALSDTHGMHRKFKIPDGDLFIHAGDFTNVGELEQVKDFNDWLGELPHLHKVVIAGNHDLSLERAPEITEKMLTNCTYLRDSGITLPPMEKFDDAGGYYDDIKIWGSPYTPYFMSDFWAFHKRGLAAQKAYWEQLPEDLDILITHGPPNRVLDLTVEGDYAGDYALSAKLSSLENPPRYHIFGHIHEGYGKKIALRDGSKWDGPQIRYANVSAVDRMYEPRENPCVEFEIY